MINKLDIKSPLPVFTPDIHTEIFKQWLQNPTWTNLARATKVCKDWNAQIKKNYPQLPLLQNILNRQILYIHPIIKFWLKIVGDPSSFDNPMSRAEIQKYIAKLEKPSPKILCILEDLKYRKDDKFISMMQLFPTINFSRKWDPEIDIRPLKQRQEIYNKIKDTINNTNLIISKEDMKIFIAWILPSIVCIATSLGTYALSSNSNIILDSLFLSCLICLTLPFPIIAIGYIILEILPYYLGNKRKNYCVLLLCPFLLLAAVLGYYSVSIKDR